MLYSSKSTFLTFSSQIPTNSVNLTKFLPFPYMRNIEYLRGTLSSHENYHIPTMRHGKTTEILSSLLWDSHKILWGIFIQEFHCPHEYCTWVKVIHLANNKTKWFSFSTKYGSWSWIYLRKHKPFLAFLTIHRNWIVVDCWDLISKKSRMPLFIKSKSWLMMIRRCWVSPH